MLQMRTRLPDRRTSPEYRTLSNRCIDCDARCHIECLSAGDPEEEDYDFQQYCLKHVRPEFFGRRPSEAAQQKKLQPAEKSSSSSIPPWHVKEERTNAEEDWWKEKEESKQLFSSRSCIISFLRSTENFSGVLMNAGVVCSSSLTFDSSHTDPTTYFFFALYTSLCVPFSTANT